MYENLRNINYFSLKERHNTKAIQNIVTLNIKSCVFENRATSYLWTASVENNDSLKLFHGRTMEQFKDFISELIDNAKLGSPFCKTVTENRESVTATIRTTPIIYIYDHNLDMDFQFLRNIFKKLSVFAASERKPFYAAVTYKGARIIFNNTNKLIPLSLDEWDKTYNLTNQTRPTYTEPTGITSETPIAPYEIAQSFYDNQIIHFGILQYKKKYFDLKSIPLTQASAVRQEIKKTLKGYGEKEWFQKCKEVTQSYTFESYSDICRAFIGGSNHINHKYKSITLKNICSFDSNSNYIYVLATKKFPTTPFIETETDNDPDYCYLYNITIEGMKCKLHNTYFPASKCDEITGLIDDDGNIKEAQYATMTITDQDLNIIKEVYEIKSITYHWIKKSKAESLPKCMIRLMMEYYNKKAQIKGTGQDSLYAMIKSALNCFYGVFVTRNIRDEIIFDEDWKKILLTKDNFAKKIEELCKGDIFITYQIGAWVTAYARRLLWNFITKLDQHVVYFDTDCVKGFFTPDDINTIETLNNQIKDTLTDVPKHDRPLGVFECDGKYDEFKTIGTKRYATLENGTITTTIAGLPKSAGLKKIKAVDELAIGVEWSEKESNLQTTYFIDDQKPFTVTDRDGVTRTINQKYVSYKKQVPFKLKEYEDFDFIRQAWMGQKTAADEITKVFRYM